MNDNEQVLPEATSPVSPPILFEPDQPSEWMFRIPMIIVGIVIITLLVTARVLAPDPGGLGTHQQLGLPECGFRRIFRFGCPSCGMTTSWAHLTRGRIPSSLSANPGGTLLGIGAMIIGPWLLISGILGRWFPKPIDLRILLASVGVIFATTIIQWIVKIYFF